MILLVSFTPIEARDNTMTSSVDSMFKRVETDSCPDPPRSGNTRIAGTAGFAMGYPTVLPNKNDSPLCPLGVRPRVPNLCLSVCNISRLAKIVKGAQQKRLGSSRVHLHSDWR